MPQSLVKILVHIVFSTKNRANLILPEKEKDLFTRDAEDRLARTLRSKVEIDRKRRGGVIHIRFGSEDELIRLVEELMGRRR